MNKELPPALKHQSGFFKVGARAVAVAHVIQIDFEDIANLRATVTLVNGEVVVATDIDALELAMRVKPSVLESRRLVWPKWAWLVHNLIGHPVMQVLALMRCYKAAFWVHDATVPRPTGRRKK